MSDFTSAKYLNKQIKARGLQKLRFYCQVCLKQCRDENGFKSHIKSASHLKNISQVTTDDIQKYSAKFETDFLTHLRINHGEKPIAANKLYNEFIQDKDHVHMNATHFTSLSKFIQHLSKEGNVKVHNLEQFSNSDDIEMGHLLISYVDNSKNNTLQKQQLEDIKKQEITDQEIKNYLLQRQIDAGLSAQPQQDESISMEPQQSTNMWKETQSISIAMPKQVKTPKVQKKKKKKAKNLFG